MSFIFNKIKSSISNNFEFILGGGFLASGFNRKPIDFNTNFCVSFDYGNYHLSYDGMKFIRNANSNIKYPTDSAVAPNGKVYVISNESGIDYILGLSTSGAQTYTNIPNKNATYIAASDTNILIGNSLGIYSQVGNWQLKLGQSNLNGMIYCLNQYFIFYSASGYLEKSIKYKTSQDGNSWSNENTLVSYPAPQFSDPLVSVENVRFINNKLTVLIRYATEAETYSIFESANGNSWNTIPIGTFNPVPNYGFPAISDIAYGNNTYFTLIAIPGSSPEFKYLTKNINSNSWTLSNPCQSNGEEIVFFKNKFTTSAARNGYFFTISTSKNIDTNFKIQSNYNFFEKIGRYDSNVFFYNGIFLSYRLNKIKYSIDGDSWIDIENDITNGSATIQNIVYGNGIFVLLLSDGKVFYSNNGINWVYSNTIFNFIYYIYLSYANGYFIINRLLQNQSTQEYENFVTKSIDAISWDISTKTNKRATKIVGNNNIYVTGEESSGYIYNLFYSSDLVNWTPVSISNIGDVTSLRYANGKFIASTIINNDITNYGEPNLILYSNDGITWNKRQLPLNTTDSYSINSIDYSNNKFYCFYSAGNYYAYSDDLLNWTYEKVPFTCSEYFNLITYDNKTILHGNIFANGGKNTLKFIK